MEVKEYLLRDISNNYDDYTISVQDEEGNIIFYGDKYDLITSNEFDDLLVLHVEEIKEEKLLIFVTYICNFSDLIWKNLGKYLYFNM